MTVVAIVPDLMDRSRLGRREGLVHVGTVESAIETGAALAIVDLSRVTSADLARLVAGVPRVVGYAPHVDDETLARAVETGVDEALPRSAFFRRVGELLDGHLGG